AVVADGMGGLACGADASRLAVKIMLHEYMTKSEEESILEALNRAIISANEAVHLMAVEKGLEEETGTTLVAAVVKDNQLFWISAGDSRLYLFRNEKITLISKDHNYANELAQDVKQGILTPEEAATHPNRNALTSFLGLNDLPEVDRNIRPFALQSGDRLMLCSDGLYNTLSEQEIEKGLKWLNPHDAAESLISDALKQDRKNQDNITVAILGLDEPETKKILKSSNNSENKKSWFPENRRKNITLLLLIFILSCILLFVSRISAYAAMPIEKMSQSTVRILCIKGEQVGSGSGFVIENGGKVVTNWHVVSCTQDGGVAGVWVGENDVIKSKVKWYSQIKDIAILELEKNLNRPSVIFVPQKEVKIAQTVYALGFPSAADDQFLDNASLSEVKVTRGIISAKVNSQSGVGLFQIDAAINPGNSGGPLFDEFGHVLGINVAKALLSAVVVNPSNLSQSPISIERLPSGEGIGWAIQADELIEELDKLNISYKQPSLLVNNQLYRLWGDSPILFLLLSIAVIVGITGIFIGFTAKGRVVIKDVVSKSRDTIMKRKASFKSGLISATPETASKPKPLLIGIKGEFKGNIIELDQSPLVIGRDPRVSHLIFSQNSSGVSKRHCTLIFDEAQMCFYLEDSWSSNGTYIIAGGDVQNGEVYPVSKIESGQKIRLSNKDRFYLSDKNQMFEVQLKF
ncbi:MAG: trypsin-like peptidase domain-containing protein, partial [Desulfamplus sp.]|nr:trypsin-like peptidase domain-containing protein [Desulfamplus sp.]